MTLPHHTTRSQRWRERRASFVPNATTIDPTEFAVDVINKPKISKAWLSQHHYLGTCPVSRLEVGLFRNGPAGRAELAGVAVFSVPTNDASISRHTGMCPSAGVNLGRFALLDEVAGNGETWFLARALRLLREAKPSIQAVTSYSDPTPRQGPTGVYSGGHVGLIYAAMGGSLYRGQTRSRTEVYSPDGAAFGDRAINKIRKEETGWRYAVAELVRRGAPPPAGPTLTAWFDDLLTTGFLSRRRRAGLHVYSFALTADARRAGALIPSFTPPKRSTSPLGCDVTALPLLDPHR